MARECCLLFRWVGIALVIRAGYANTHAPGQGERLVLSAVEGL